MTNKRVIMPKEFKVGTIQKVKNVLYEREQQKKEKGKLYRINSKRHQSLISNTSIIK